MPRWTPRSRLNRPRSGSTRYAVRYANDDGVFANGDQYYGGRERYDREFDDEPRISVRFEGGPPIASPRDQMPPFANERDFTPIRTRRARF